MKFGLKKLDALLLKSFLGPFAITFVLVLFTFIMQFYWLYMDDLIGKGLGVMMMVKLLFYMIPALVPMALPLIVMLSSIMTLGNLGEHYELVAIKSSGISLFRFMRPLFVFILVLAAGAFFFNNNVIPVANLKAYSLLYDMRNQKPTSSISEGVFSNDMKDYSIRVEKKDKDGSTIYGVIIYDHSDGKGNTNVVTAEKGKMYNSPSGNFLVFELENGWRYTEMGEKGSKDLMRMHFDKWFLTFDMSDFAFKRTNEDQFSGREDMMDILQLTSSIDSFNNKKIYNYNNAYLNIQPYASVLKNKANDSALIEMIVENKYQPTAYKESFFELVPDSSKKMVIDNVVISARNVERSLSVLLVDLDFNDKKINKFWIAYHQKFTLSIACIILFFIGAPLGAIIRKGGLGMPVLVAIIFFLVYLTLSTTGVKLAEQKELSPFEGLWLANIILIPIAVFIMIKAKNDSNLFNKDLYNKVVRKIKSIFIKENK